MGHWHFKRIQPHTLAKLLQLSSYFRPPPSLLPSILFRTPRLSETPPQSRNVCVTTRVRPQTQREHIIRPRPPPRTRIEEKVGALQGGSRFFFQFSTTPFHTWMMEQQWRKLFVFCRNDRRPGKKQCNGPYRLALPRITTSSKESDCRCREL